MGWFGRLWTLSDGQHTVSAEILPLEDGSLELCYLRDGQISALLQSRDGGDLLRDAAIERFWFEARGWQECTTRPLPDGGQWVSLETGE